MITHLQYMSKTTLKEVVLVPVVLKENQIGLELFYN
jgi:hypothetical protein